MVKISRLLLCITLFTTTTFAWNRAGHLISGAITYQTLKLERLQNWWRFPPKIS